MTTQSASYPENSDFVRYLLTEYDNIAAAHFKTLEMISEFIKHYLTIVAIPFTVIVLLFNIDYLRNAVSQNLPGIAIAPILAILFWVIGIIGLLMLWHTVNLRWDALLYARTINGIRKYFYDNHDRISLAEKVRLRVLPQSPYFPEFREFAYFGPVVLAFAIFNTLYGYAGVVAWRYGLGHQSPFGLQAAVVAGLFFTLHIFVYLFFAQQREFRYLRSNVIGVDIDGVLNLHREHFCRLLRENTGKELTPDQITSIPVRDCITLGVSQSDEFAVFNDPRYWTEMPMIPGAADVLWRLRNSMRLKVHIFTSRPWPIFINSSKDQNRDSIKDWAQASKEYRKKVWSKGSWGFPMRNYVEELIRLRPYKFRRLKWVLMTLLSIEKPIEKITRDWLLDHEFSYDRLMVEHGSEEVIDPSAHIHNRFYASRIIPIKYFVEDDVTKAEKLAYICDIVFLIDHPYNQKDNLPANVIRVVSWKDIHQHMRSLW